MVPYYFKTINSFSTWAGEYVLHLMRITGSIAWMDVNGILESLTMLITQSGLRLVKVFWTITREEVIESLI